MGLTQAQLAERVGCRQGTIARIEGGRVPKPALMTELIRVTGLVPNDFYPAAEPEEVAA